MKACSKRFVSRKARRRLKILAGDLPGNTIRCLLEDDDDDARGHEDSRPAGDAKVLYEIHASGIRTLDSVNASDASIKVMMRPPPEEAEVVASGLPLYTEESTHDGKETFPTGQQPTREAWIGTRLPPAFTEACRICLFSGRDRKHSSAMYLPVTQEGREAVLVNAIPARHRTQFSAHMPIWRWRSSQGGLLWVSRRFQDAEMTALETRLCLLDDYDRLVAVLDGWDGLDFEHAAINGSGRLGAGRKSVLALYADLGAALLGEILGSLCTLAVQVRRVTAELKKEDDERRGNTP